jgi:hypothetical protein
MWVDYMKTFGAILKELTRWEEGEDSSRLINNQGNSGRQEFGALTGV